MSLHTASKYLASKGRRGDTELVHMTKDEIKGLQQLALAHGGSLTINPETGLVEAGILKTLLPMVGGAALMMIPGMQGFGGALAASAIMGGGMYAATGSLKEGLLAGLGAFGGANIASGLAAAGAGAAEAGAAGAIEGGVGAAGSSGASTAASTVPEFAMFGGDTAASTLASGASGASGAASTAASTAPEFAMFGGDTAASTLASGAPNVAPAAAADTSMFGTQAMADAQAAAGKTLAGAPMPAAPTPPTGLGGSFTQNLQNAYKGLPDIGKVIMNAPLKTAGAALAPFAMGATDSGVQGFPPDQDSGSSGLMGISPDFQAYTPTPPSPAYQAQYQDYKKKGVGGVGALASGGIAALAGGGMDPMNPIQNPVYPQSQQDNTQFATSSQYPNSMKSAMAADYDTRTNPMTGQELPMGLAAGGTTKQHLSSSPSMPSGGIFRDTDPDTASKDAYQAALIRLQKANKLAGLKAVPMPKANMEKLGGVDFDVDEKAGGGIAHYNLGGYSDGGRMLKGPGDGMSDSIPASIGGKQAARLADGEFVVPADVVSHLGNGSTDAGAKKLYGMMDKVRQARTGTKKQGKQIKADKYLPK